MGLKKKLTLGILTLATIIGTVGGSDGYPPFHTKKVGTSYGINVGVFNELMPGSKHYGINIGIVTTNSGTINGVNLGLGTGNEGRINGINSGILNIQNVATKYLSVAAKVNGLEVGTFNFPTSEFGRDYAPTRVNGVQIGLGNDGQGNLIQFGIYNHNISSDGKHKRGVPILNWRFD